MSLLASCLERPCRVCTRQPYQIPETCVASYSSYSPHLATSPTVDHTRSTTRNIVTLYIYIYILSALQNLGIVVKTDWCVRGVKYCDWRTTTFRTPAPPRGQTNYNLCGLSPVGNCGSKGVNTICGRMLHVLCFQFRFTNVWVPRPICVEVQNRRTGDHHGFDRE